MRILHTHLLCIVFASVFMIAFLACFCRAGYFNKLLIKLGLVAEKPPVLDAVNSWHTCLEQMNVQADIVFLGDSITRNGDFRSFFPAKRICNLGCAGDSILNIVARVPMIPTVGPKTVVVMAGINTLASRSLRQSLQHFQLLLDALGQNCPHSDVIILSVLPVHAKSRYCNNRKITLFNTAIQQLAQSRGYSYVDLFSLYAENGSLPEYHSSDGLHIHPSSYNIWAKAISPYIEFQ